MTLSLTLSLIVAAIWGYLLAFRGGFWLANTPGCRLMISTSQRSRAW